MKFIRIAGFCLAAMFVMSMVAAGTASAAPHWLVCLPWTNSPTRYSEHQCKEASGTGGWEWSELKNTELPVRTHGTLTLITSGVPIVKEVEIKCSGSDVGTVGPGGKSTTTSITAENCTAGKNCEEIIGKVEAVNLPWSSEALETEGKIHGTITNGKTGTSAPGWKASCKVLGVKEENICTSTQGLVVLESKNTPGAETPLLVLADFIEPNKPKAGCTVKGTEGEVRGSIAILLENKWGLRISK